VSAPQQKPLELIIARNLLTSIITPALLVGEEGQLLFFNEAAGAMLGRRFEDTGTLSSSEWTGKFGPFGPDNLPIPYDEIPATIAVRHQRAFQWTFRICVAGNHYTDVEASTIPIVGQGGSSGAVVIFWPVSEAETVKGEDRG
jgi:PAS domain-containing protein